MISLASGQDLAPDVVLQGPEISPPTSAFNTFDSGAVKLTLAKIGLVRLVSNLASFLKENYG
jgi:hypothetical protein